MNRPTPSNTVAVIIGADNIRAECPTCGAEGVWPTGDADFAAERIRVHPDECAVGSDPLSPTDSYGGDVRPGCDSFATARRELLGGA